MNHTFSREKQSLRRTVTFLGLLLFVATLSLISFTPAQAMTVKSGKQVNIGENKQLSSDLYVLSGVPTFAGSVVGDTTLAGGKVFYNGSTSEDVLLLGGDVGISGNAGGDVRALGGSILVSGQASSTGVFVGGNVVLLPKSAIRGDVLILSAGAIVRGEVDGSVSIYAKNVLINGKVDGDLDIHGKNITIGENAVVGGDFTYTSAHSANILSDAKILGATHFNKKNAGEGAVIATVASFAIPFAMLLLSAFFFGLLWRRRSEEMLADAVSASVWKYFLSGIVTMLFMPVVAIILIGTQILIPLGILLLLIYGTLLLLAWVYSAILLGNVLFHFLERDKPFTISWQGIVLGAILFTFIPLIPSVGVLIDLIIYLIALGSLSLFVRRAVKKARK